MFSIGRVNWIEVLRECDPEVAEDLWALDSKIGLIRKGQPFTDGQLVYLLIVLMAGKRPARRDDFSAAARVLAGSRPDVATAAAAIALA